MKKQLNRQAIMKGNGQDPGRSAHHHHHKDMRTRNNKIVSSSTDQQPTQLPTEFQPLNNALETQPEAAMDGEYQSTQRSEKDQLLIVEDGEKQIIPKRHKNKKSNDENVAISHHKANQVVPMNASSENLQGQSKRVEQKSSIVQHSASGLANMSENNTGGGENFSLTGSGAMDKFGSPFHGTLAERKSGASTNQSIEKSRRESVKVRVSLLNLQAVTAMQEKEQKKHQAMLSVLKSGVFNNSTSIQNNSSANQSQDYSVAGGGNPKRESKTQSRRGSANSPAFHMNSGANYPQDGSPKSKTHKRSSLVIKSSTEKHPLAVETKKGPSSRVVQFLNTKSKDEIIREIEENSRKNSRRSSSRELQKVNVPPRSTTSRYIDSKKNSSLALDIAEVQQPQNNSMEDPDSMENKPENEKMVFELRKMLMKGTVKMAKKANNRHQKIERERVKKENNLEDEEDSEISSIDCEDEEEGFNLMDEEERKNHLQELWKKAYLKGRAGAQVIRFFADLNRKIYLFGVSKRLEEIEQEEHPPPYILQPSSNIKSYWNSINIALLLYTAIYMPYRISFIDDDNTFQMVLDWSIDSLFFIDIIITFFSAYEEADGYIESNWKKIAITYVRSWFFLDLLACFPFQVLDTKGNDSDYSDQSSQQSINYQKLIRLMRLPRLFRFIKIMKILKQIKFLNNYKWYQRMMNVLNMNAGILRMIQAFISQVVLTHLMACFWYLSAKIDDFDMDTWVYRKKLVDADNLTLYQYSFYWALQTVITVGYGDIPPITSTELKLTLVWMFFGIVFYSFIIAGYTSIVKTNIEIDASIQLKIKSITELAKLAGIPMDMSQKIKKYIENNYETFYNKDDEVQIIKLLPPSLRDEVLTNAFGEVVEKVKYFRELEDVDFLWKVLPLLTPLKIEITEQLYQKGDEADEIFYVIKGTVTMYTEKGNPFVKYKEGDQFGDSDTLLNLERDCKCIAMTNLKLMVLKINDSFVKQFHMLEKVLIEMILIARKKRDNHKRLMIEADKQAKRDLMIQQLLKNKQMLYHYIATNERQIQIMTRRLQMSTQQLANMRSENSNLRTTLQKSNNNLREKQRADEYGTYGIGSYSDSSERQKAQTLFNHFFVTLQRARLRAERIQAQIVAQEENEVSASMTSPLNQSQTPFQNQDQSQQATNRNRALQQLNIIVDHEFDSNSIGGEGEHVSRGHSPLAMKNQIMKKNKSSQDVLNVPNSNGLQEISEAESDSSSVNGSKKDMNHLQQPKVEKSQNNEKRKTSSFPQDFNMVNALSVERSPNLDKSVSSSSMRDQSIVKQEPKLSRESDMVKSEVLSTPSPQKIEPSHRASPVANDTGRGSKDSKLKNQHTFGGTPLYKTNSNAHNNHGGGGRGYKMLEMEDIKINVTSKLSLLDKCLQAVFNEDEIQEVYSTFPYLVAMNVDSRDEKPRFPFAREQYELGRSQFMRDGGGKSSLLQPSTPSPQPMRSEGIHNRLMNQIGMSNNPTGYQSEDSATPQKMIRRKNASSSNLESGSGNGGGGDGKTSRSSKWSDYTPTARTNNNVKGYFGQLASAHGSSLKNDYQQRSNSNDISNRGQGEGFREPIEHGTYNSRTRSNEIHNPPQPVHIVNSAQKIKQQERQNSGDSDESLGRALQIPVQTQPEIHIQMQGETPSKRVNAVVPGGGETSNKSSKSLNFPQSIKASSNFGENIKNSNHNEKQRSSMGQQSASQADDNSRKHRGVSVRKIKVRKLSYARHSAGGAGRSVQPSRIKSDENQDSAIPFGNILGILHQKQAPIISPLVMERIRSEQGRFTVSPKVSNMSQAMVKSIDKPQVLIISASGDQKLSQNLARFSNSSQQNSKSTHLQEALQLAIESLKNNDKAGNSSNLMKKNSSAPGAQNAQHAAGLLGKPPSSNQSDAKSTNFNQSKKLDSFTDYSMKQQVQPQSIRGGVEETSNISQGGIPATKKLSGMNLPQDSERTKFLDDLLLERGILQKDQKPSTLSVEKELAVNFKSHSATSAQNQQILLTPSKLAGTPQNIGGVKQDSQDMKDILTEEIYKNLPKMHKHGKGSNKEDSHYQHHHQTQGLGPISEYPNEDDCMTLELHEEEIEFYGDPSVEGIARFNAEMPQLSLHFLEMQAALDQVSKATHLISRTSQSNKVKFNIMDKRLDSMGTLLDNMKGQFMKYKQSKEQLASLKAGLKFEPTTKVELYQD